MIKSIINPDSAYVCEKSHIMIESAIIDILIDVSEMSEKVKTWISPICDFLALISLKQAMGV